MQFEASLPVDIRYRTVDGLTIRRDLKSFLGVRCELAQVSRLQTKQNPRKIKDLTGARRF